MSYCRFRTYCDLYIYDDVAGGITCCGCLLQTYYNAETPEEMVEHVREHIAAGHHVPVYVIPALERESRVVVADSGTEEVPAGSQVQ